MAGRVIYSAKLGQVIASCGHEVHPYIPPSGGLPGPVGRRNIAEAKIKPCYKCRPCPGGHIFYNWPEAACENEEPHLIGVHDLAVRKEE